MRRFDLRHFVIALPILVGVLFLNTSCRPEATPTPSSQMVSAPNWEGKLVRKPGDSPEESKVYVVKDGKRHWVVSGAWLKPHGFNWPDDVHTIKAAELDAIPQGEPIQ